VMVLSVYYKSQINQLVLCQDSIEFRRSAGKLSTTTAPGHYKIEFSFMDYNESLSNRMKQEGFPSSLLSIIIQNLSVHQHLTISHCLPNQYVCSK